MSDFSLLRWIEMGKGKKKGPHTIAEAEKAKWDQKPEWDVCLFRYLFDVQDDGLLVLTEAGKSELSLMRSSGG